jgi:hypothetical protein
VLDEKILMKFVSKLLTITSSRHSRIIAVQSTVDTRESPTLLCKLVLWGTVWQVHILPKNVGGKVHRDFFLNSFQNLLQIVPLFVTARFVHGTSLIF